VGSDDVYCPTSRPNAVGHSFPAGRVIESGNFASCADDSIQWCVPVVLDAARAFIQHWLIVKSSADEFVETALGVSSR